METSIQMEIIAVVGILSGVALYLGQYDLAQIGLVGLIGYLGGQTFIKSRNTSNEVKEDNL